ncbi:MAG: PDZ domain-containing protein [Acidobacteria bacterium]|nr:PDZ domain-containing protein [Acidobacteriota bacterium]
MRTALALLFLALPIHGGQEDDLERSVRQLAELLSVVEERAADPVDTAGALYKGAIPAMVRRLDPHSAFLDPQQFESLKEMQRSTEKGFGSVVSLNHGRVIVLQTLPESPSMRAGLAPGDEIVAINGYQIAALNIDQLVALLSQSRQQRAELMVLRPNFSRLLPMTLTPEELADPSVSLQFVLSEDVGYIKVANFETDTHVELREAIEKLGGHKLKGLVLDFRRNPGGVIEAAVRMAAMFLESGQRILWIRGREGPQEEVRVPPGNEPYRFPVAILVNDETASASELVAGALQDHDRATIVGQRSFGKGLVQSVFELSEETGLALTTALYLSPSGRPIQRPLNDCADYQLTACPDDGPVREYPTDSGRMIPGGGGLQPDEAALPRQYSAFEYWLGSSSAILSYARNYVSSRKQPIEPSFEVTPAMLDDFQLYLSQHGTSVPLSEWTSAVDFIRYNLRQEIFNLTLGVEFGDEVELRNDPQVKAALEAVLR